MIKFEKIMPGMTLLDVHSVRMGNTTVRQLACWPVEIISVDRQMRTAMASWNSNPPRRYSQRYLCKLYAKEPKKYRDQQERRRSGGIL